MTTGVLRIAGTRHRSPSRSVAPGLLLSLAAKAAFAAPPGIESNNLELVARSVAEHSYRAPNEDRGNDLVQAASYTVSGVADPGELRTGPTARAEANAADGDDGRSKSLDDLLVEFLDSL